MPNQQDKDCPSKVPCNHAPQALHVHVVCEECLAGLIAAERERCAKIAEEHRGALKEKEYEPCGNEDDSYSDGLNNGTVWASDDIAKKIRKTEQR